MICNDYKLPMYFKLHDKKIGDEFESDLRSNKHHSSSSEIKTSKKFRPVRDLNLRPLRYWCSSPASYFHHCEDHFLIHFLKCSSHIYDFQISIVTEKGTW